jgi:hypothetical protein
VLQRIPQVADEIVIASLVAKDVDECCVLVGETGVGGMEVGHRTKRGEWFNASYQLYEKAVAEKILAEWSGEEKKNCNGRSEGTDGVRTLGG